MSAACRQFRRLSAELTTIETSSAASCTRCQGGGGGFSRGGGAVACAWGCVGLLGWGDLAVVEKDCEIVLGEGFGFQGVRGDDDGFDGAFQSEAGAGLIGFPFFGAGFVGEDGGEVDFPSVEGAEAGEAVGVVAEGDDPFLAGGVSVWIWRGACASELDFFIEGHADHLLGDPVFEFVLGVFVPVVGCLGTEIVGDFVEDVGHGGEAAFVGLGDGLSGGGGGWLGSRGGSGGGGEEENWDDGPEVLFHGSFLSVSARYRGGVLIDGVWGWKKKVHIGFGMGEGNVAATATANGRGWSWVGCRRCGGASRRFVGGRWGRIFARW